MENEADWEMFPPIPPFSTSNKISGNYFFSPRKQGGQPERSKETRKDSNSLVDPVFFVDVWSDDDSFYFLPFINGEP